MFRISSMTAAASLALALAAPAQATTLLDTGTPNGLDLPLMLSTDQSLAVQFSSADSELIQSVLSYVTDPDGTNQGNTFQVALYSNAGSGSTALPGTQLFAADVTFNANGWNGASGLNWLISAGTYWAVIQETGASTANGLVATANKPAGPALAAYSDFGTWASSTSGYGVQVLADPVPEPQSLALLLAGLGVMGWASRRAR